jgi:hypothetical protein
MSLFQKARLVPRFRTLSLLVAIASLELVAGCDTAPQVAQVHGTITYNGVPVPTGTITFYPVEGGRTAVGMITKDGSYSLSRTTLGDGVIVGKYKVTIEATETAAQSNTTQQVKSVADEMYVIPDARASAPPKEWVPVKYSTVESAGLTATVNSGPNQIDFNLR